MTPLTSAARIPDSVHMPATIIHLRPQRSLNAPVASWHTPHTAG